MDKKYYGFVGVYIFTYAALGALLPLLGQYLAHIGFDGVQIGTITATATSVGIFASPFWGSRYHRNKNSPKVIVLLCFALTIVVLGIISIKTYVLFVVAYALFSFFQSPVMPLSDAMTLEENMPFGAIRKWGSLSFAAGVFIAGQLADAADLVVIFPLCAVGYSIAGIIIIIMGKQQNIKKESQEGERTTLEEVMISEAVTEAEIAINGEQNLSIYEEIEAEADCGMKNKADYRSLLGNKKLMALLFSAFFICGTNVANNTYFGFLYKDVGGSIAGIGIAFLLMCSSEAPFMAWTERLSAKFGMEKIILVSMMISALRYFWYSTGPAPELLLGTFFLQGMVNGIVLIEFIRYTAKLVEPVMIGMAMTLYQALSSNCSSIICQLVGGAILDSYSGMQVYLFFGIYNLIGIILYISFGLYKDVGKS